MQALPTCSFLHIAECTFNQEEINQSNVGPIARELITGKCSPCSCATLGLTRAYTISYIKELLLKCTCTGWHHSTYCHFGKQSVSIGHLLSHIKKCNFAPYLRGVVNHACKHVYRTHAVMSTVWNILLRLGTCGCLCDKWYVVLEFSFLAASCTHFMKYSQYHVRLVRYWIDFLYTKQ